MAKLPVGTGYSHRINYHVEDCAYDANIDKNGAGRISLGSPVAADTDGILDGQSIASASSTTTLAATYDEDNMGTYGRNVTVVASGAATSTVTVHGFDYLNQPMTEVLTLNGTSAVAGVKAFKRVTEVEWGATGSTTIDLGWGNVLGLPYAMVKMDAEFVDGAVPGSAGTFTAAVTTDPQTATTGDPRGRYAPHSGNLPDGSREFEIAGYFLEGNLHGVAHYSA